VPDPGVLQGTDMEIFLKRAGSMGFFTAYGPVPNDFCYGEIPG